VENAGDTEDEEIDETDKPFIDFTIRLTDRNGSVLEFPLSDFTPLQHPLKRKMTKLGFMQPQAEWEIILQTYSFPLRRYAEDHPGFDFEQISGMSFIFDVVPEGVIAVNDIGVRRTLDATHY